MSERLEKARQTMRDTLRRYAEIEHPDRDHPALAWKFERDVEVDLADLSAFEAVVREAALTARYDALRGATTPEGNV